MQRMGQRDVHQVHVGVCKQFVVAAVCARDVKALSKGLRLLERARADCQTRSIRHRVQRFRRLLRDVARTDNSYMEIIAHKNEISRLAPLARNDKKGVISTKAAGRMEKSMLEGRCGGRYIRRSCRGR